MPCEEDPMEPLNMKSIGQLTRGEKRWMVNSAYGNSGVMLGSTEAKQMLTDEDLQVTFDYLQWQYISYRVAMLKPSCVKVAMMEGLSTEEGSLAVLEAKEIMKQYDYVVVPVHSEVPLHWTVIMLRMKTGSDEVEQCHYIDWLQNVENNRRYAQKFLKFVTLQGESYMKLPGAFNKYRQASGSNDCGLAVWWALEVFMKEIRMEGAWRLSPNPAEWRKRLTTLKTTLHDERGVWLLEEATNKKPKAMVALPGTKILERAEMMKEITKHWKAKSLKHKASQFFTCSRCRWSQSGDGCFGCNPHKAAEVKADREKEAEQLKIALRQALEHCKSLGLLEETEPEDKLWKSKKLDGGGDIMM
jgi:hypothetical protein